LLEVHHSEFQGRDTYVNLVEVPWWAVLHDFRIDAPTIPLSLLWWFSILFPFHKTFRCWFLFKVVQVRSSLAGFQHALFNGWRISFQSVCKLVPLLSRKQTRISRPISGDDSFIPEPPQHIFLAGHWATKRPW
jgi:hypothetical protein